ncbi:uncharacterized protein B0H18DRAFT_33015 [Fomitopsis serialis]|uniref:uncharacterized protein n=1 Tax=Fomitopsis serialis TaxID=139415 RepID=UPI00200855B3|nr:uncharacterized protein B0H18DRAFT_33015 [Neoantrodia serialis]KAH9932635.1 hypothetical protein B0H18DRAFT_33015 [Neoantrodia serialis]
MSTALHINTIHDIITAVEKSDSSHGIFTSNSTMRKRARYLCAEAHTLLSMLKFRGEMDADAKAEYEYVYAWCVQPSSRSLHSTDGHTSPRSRPPSSYQRAGYHTNARVQLEAAQDLWSFALVRPHPPSARSHSTGSARAKPGTRPTTSSPKPAAQVGPSARTATRPALPSYRRRPRTGSTPRLPP